MILILYLTGVLTAIGIMFGNDDWKDEFDTPTQKVIVFIVCVGLSWITVGFAIGAANKNK